MIVDNLTMESHNGPCSSSYNLGVTDGDKSISGNEWR